MLKRVVCLSVCAVLMWCLPVSAYAQFETAAVVGIVSDASGAVVPVAAIVTLRLHVGADGDAPEMVAREAALLQARRSA